MRLEDLQRQWQRLDQKLDHLIAVQTEIALRPARRRVTRLAFWPALDVAFSAAVLLFAGSFLGDHWPDPRLVLPAVVVMLAAVALLGDSVRQLVRVSEIDWAASVADIQGSLEKLRAAKIRQFKWVILLSPLVSFCGLVVGLHGLAAWASGGRADVMAALPPAWVVGNYVFGVLFVPAGYYLARYLAAKCGRSRWWQSVLDDISGRSLADAAADVERWADLRRSV